MKESQRGVLLSVGEGGCPVLAVNGSISVVGRHSLGASVARQAALEQVIDIKVFTFTVLLDLVHIPHANGPNSGP